MSTGVVRSVLTSHREQISIVAGEKGTERVQTWGSSGEFG